MAERDILLQIQHELGQLTGEMSSLKEVTAEGFRGVHMRQDKTNGNVLRNSERITELEKCEANREIKTNEKIGKLSGDYKVSKFQIGFVWTLIVVIATTVITNLLDKIM